MKMSFDLSFLRRTLTMALAATFLVSSSILAADEKQLSPSELTESVVRQVLKELDAHRDEMRKDPSKIRKMVDAHFLPHFDTQYAAQLVLAKHWKDATPEQRKRFIAAFYQSLIQNYGEALLDFTPDRLTIQPYRGEPDAKSATVRTEVRRDNGSRVPVNLSMRKTSAGWKAYDVTIEGVSYVKSFRTDFESEIQQKGLDSVIARLESQQASGNMKKTGGEKSGGK
jgi:phospholipid transport system substrate-binding protein